MAGDGEGLRDSRGRVIEYMRISLTDACNFRCGFCVPDDDTPTCGDGGKRLCGDELLRLGRIFAALGVRHFKITGGEPFLFPDALAVMSEFGKIPGVAGVTVTTNGSSLDRHAGALAAMGVAGVNVSLNAMTEEGHERITGVRFGLGRVLDNIVTAVTAGLRVKINMVPLRGINERDIVPLLEFALTRDIPVRFIELMPLGQGKRYSGLSFAEVRRLVEARFGSAAVTTERLGNGPATYLSLPGFAARIGCIAAVSQGFCAVCNRIRLSCGGFLRTCLHHGHGIDLFSPLRSGAGDAAIADLVRAAVLDKPGGHRFVDGDSESGCVPMFRIGG